MSAITAKASRKMKKYAVLTREPRCFLGSFDFSWEQRKLNEVVNVYDGVHQTPDYKDSGVMFLSVENISTLKSEKYISEEAFQRDYKVYPQKGDILMTRIGDVGTPNVVEATEKVAFYVSLALLKPTKINSYFLCNSIQSPLFQKGLKDRTLVTAIPQKINKDEIGKVNIILPTSSQEQQLIGDYFRNLDNLITLHQRECISFTARAGRLILTANKKRNTSSWEQRKAIDIADYSKGNGYSKGDLTEVGTPIILYGRLYTKYQFAISEVDTFAVPRNGAVYSQGNEVIVPASGETAEDIARASAVEKSGVLLGGDLNILRPFDFINPLFLALAISNGEPQKELAKKAQGKSVVHIHNTDIQEVTMAYPSKTEQDRIVSVFRQLDNLITLHQRKPFLMKWRTSDANRNQTNRLVL